MLLCTEDHHTSVISLQCFCGLYLYTPVQRYFACLVLSSMALLWSRWNTSSALCAQGNSLIDGLGFAGIIYSPSAGFFKLLNLTLSSYVIKNKATYVVEFSTSAETNVAQIIWTFSLSFVGCSQTIPWVLWCWSENNRWNETIAVFRIKISSRVRGSLHPLSTHDNWTQQLLTPHCRL